LALDRRDETLSLGNIRRDPKQQAIGQQRRIQVQRSAERL
jgi:hypothetical protein